MCGLYAETCVYEVGMNSKRFSYGTLNFKTFYVLIAHHREKSVAAGTRFVIL